MNSPEAQQTFFNLNHSEGVNESERLLTKLCQTSFLRLWAHTNLFTDEGIRDTKGSGKEFCDALLVFGDDVVILSDKHKPFQLHKPLEVAWPRWYREAIHGSIRQLYGARNWLLRFPDRIFHDAACKSPLTVKIPASDRVRVHLIAVTRGSREGALKHELGSSMGSLAIASVLKGDEHQQAPFTVGNPFPGKPFVHVLDEVSVELLFSELDTATDFLDYLKEREALLGVEGRAVFAPGEEDLLAMYLQQTDALNKHRFILTASAQELPDLIIFDEGAYTGLADSGHYRRKKTADEPSYWWDSLVERFIALADPLIGIPGVTATAQDVEIALRFMAGEPRFQRRLLVNSFGACIRKARGNGRMARLVVPSAQGSPVYIFLMVPKLDDESYEEYRHHRVALLAAYCRLGKLRFPDKEVFIGLGFDHPDKSYAGGSEDLFVWEQASLTEEQKEELEEMRQELGLLGDSIQVSDYRADEFPAEVLTHSVKKDDKSASKKKDKQEKRNKKLKAASARKNRAKK